MFPMKLEKQRNRNRAERGSLPETAGNNKESSRLTK